MMNGPPVGAFDPITRALYVAAEELADPELEQFGFNAYLLAAVIFDRWRSSHPSDAARPRQVVFLEPTYELGATDDGNE